MFIQWHNPLSWVVILHSIPNDGIAMLHMAYILMIYLTTCIDYIFGSNKVINLYIRNNVGYLCFER